MSTQPTTYRYHSQGDRTRPKRTHWRYAHLTRLYQRLETLIASESLSTGGRILDFGCADKPYETLFRQKFSEYIGADLPGNKEADINLNADGTLPVGDSCFDGVLSTQVLEHVPDPDLYLMEAGRVLIPGGHLILSTHGFWPYHPVPTDYWRWTLDGLTLLLNRHDFELVQTASVLGFASTALQLWQDATYRRLPTWCRPAYFGFIQGMISLLEWRHTDYVSPNTDVFVVLARKLT